MSAMRGVVSLLRAVGVLALILMLCAWLFPRSLQHLLGRPDKPPTPAASTASPSIAASAAALVPAPAALPVLHASPSQFAVAQWLGSKYHVSAAAIVALIVEADKLSRAYNLSPNLIIAVMAIESNFHPYIQSEAGAQGLMQVMPVIHAKRYEKFGGKSSFMDPIVGLKVGAEILRHCVKLKGSETEALRFYFGGGAASDGYIDKVHVEQKKLDLVAAGGRVPVN